MEEITAVIPVFNEAKLIASCLDQIKIYVDKIILVDGDGKGQSTDETLDIAKDVITKGLVTIPYQGNRWTRKDAISQGIAEVSSPYIMPLSADMIFDNFEDAIEAHEIYGEEKIIQCRHIELWCDIYHAREIKESPVFYTKQTWENKVLDNMPKLLVMSCSRYHLGWIRPFDQQVKKHVRNIKSGHWGDLGSKIIALGEQAIESWAVHHVLGYKRTPGQDIYPVEIIREQYNNWSSNNGLPEYTSEYEDRYNDNFYAGIMNSVSPELLR